MTPEEKAGKRASLVERLEEIRPSCSHGRKIRYLLDQPRAIAGTGARCACCENVFYAPNGQTLCPRCEGGDLP